MSHKIIRLPEVKTLTGLSRTTIYSRMHEGNFPKSIPLGERAVGWYAADVDKWIESKVAQSKAKTNSEVVR